MFTLDFSQTQSIKCFSVPPWFYDSLDGYEAKADMVLFAFLQR